MVIALRLAGSGTFPGSHSMGVIEPDQPIAVLGMERKRITQAMGLSGVSSTRFTSNFTQCPPSSSITKTSPSSSKSVSRQESRATGLVMGYQIMIIMTT